MTKPKLFTASNDVLDMSCLNGVRALANVLVVLSHCWMSWSASMPYDTLRRLGNTRWLPWLVTQGVVGADTFLVLGALLATYHLVPALERVPSGPKQRGDSCLRVVRAYWWRRALRILPAYLTANLAMLVMFWGGPSAMPWPPVAAHAIGIMYAACPRALWANAIFATNQIADNCGSMLWTISVLVHFYIAWPLLLCALRPRQPGFRARVATALAVLTAAGTAWRLWSASRTTFHLPVGDLTVPEEEANLEALLQAIYLPTLSRVAELAVGAAAGLALRSHGAVSWAKRRRVLVSAVAVALQAAYLLTVSGGNLYPPVDAPRLPRHVATAAAALAFFGSPFHACWISAALLAMALRSNPMHGAAARLLGTRPFAWAADLSYSVYLFHDMVKILLLAAAPGLFASLVAGAPVAALAALAGATLAGSYAVAWLNWWLVERRF